MKSSLDFRNELDELCDEFEQRWEYPAPELVREFLNRIDKANRDSLFAELLQIDRERCEKTGRSFPIHDYHNHLPQDASSIDRLLSDVEPDQKTIDGLVIPRRSYQKIPGLPPAFGPYRLSEPLGFGGMSVVYRAEHLELKRDVALKILDSTAIDAVSRIQAEAQMIAGLKHPHIVQVFDTGTVVDRPYLALELMDAGSLDDLLTEQVLPARKAADVLLKIAEATSVAHQEGVIHRDLKPANVLISADHEPKLADFGLARNMNSQSQTMSGALLGTPGYMSPEQTTGGEPTVAMDVYGLGGILYACLTGRPPFRGASVPDTLTMIRHVDPVPVRQLVPSIPVDLESICLKCLQKSAADRYPTAQHLADDLKAFLDGRTVVARPTTRLQKVSRWCRRNPPVALLTAALFLTVAAGFAGVVTQWRRAESNATAYQQQAVLAQEQATDLAEEAAKLTTVRDFILSVLGSAQADELGKNVTVRQALEAAAIRADSIFRDQPHLEAPVRLTLGDTFRSLGEGEESVYQFQRGLKLYEQELGRDHPDTLDAMDSLAGAIRSFGLPDDQLEAARLREYVLARQIEMHGESAFESIVAMNNLSTVYLKMDRIDDADQLLCRAADLLELHSEVPTAVSDPIIYHLTQIYREREDFDRAKQELEGLIARLNQRIDEEDELSRGPITTRLKVECDLAAVLQKQGKFEESWQLYRKVFTERRDWLGITHPHTMSTRRRLTRFLIDNEHFEDAFPIVKACYWNHFEDLGISDSRTRGVRRYYVRALIGVGQLKEAEDLLRNTLQETKDQRGDDHRYTREAEEELNDFLEMHE